MARQMPIDIRRRSSDPIVILIRVTVIFFCSQSGAIDPTAARARSGPRDQATFSKILAYYERRSQPNTGARKHCPNERTLIRRAATSLMGQQETRASQQSAAFRSTDRRGQAAKVAA
jgi:hypothetical protein